MSTMTHARPIVNRTDTTDHAERYVPTAADLAELAAWRAATEDPGHYLGPEPLEALEACHVCDGDDDLLESEEWVVNRAAPPCPHCGGYHRDLDEGDWWNTMDDDAIQARWDAMSIPGAHYTTVVDRRGRTLASNRPGAIRLDAEEEARLYGWIA